ncbi:MAG: YciI family protein [bacterium]|nr:YciI family protein [bacterium]
MKHFIIELTYTAPTERIEAAVAEHRAYLQKGYDAGLLLCSGPQVPRVGGVIVARGESREVIERFFADDPFNTNIVASYRIIEFDPVKRQPFLEGWI